MLSPTAANGHSITKHQAYLNKRAVFKRMLFPQKVSVMVASTTSMQY